MPRRGQAETLVGVPWGQREAVDTARIKDAMRMTRRQNELKSDRIHHEVMYPHDTTPSEESGKNSRFRKPDDQIVGGNVGGLGNIVVRDGFSRCAQNIM